MAERDHGHGLTPPTFDEPTRVLIVAAPVLPRHRRRPDRGRPGGAGRGRGHGTSWSRCPARWRSRPRSGSPSRSGDFDGYVALGCVIRGETTHYETVCNDSSRGLTLLGLEGLCIGNGILTVENAAQAEVRADPAGGEQGRRRGGGLPASDRAGPALRAGRARAPGGVGATRPDRQDATGMTAPAETKKPTAAQARRMRTAARLYAVQALFQMEAAGAALEPCSRSSRRTGSGPSSTACAGTTPTSRISARW